MPYILIKVKSKYCYLDQALSGNAFNLDLSIVRAVTNLFTETFTTFHFKCDYFIALYQAIENLCFYYRRNRSSSGKVAIGINQ